MDGAFRIIAYCAFATTVFFSTGCGDGLVDLKAHVTLDGKPLEGASVALYGGSGETRNRPASGMTDANGDVTFTTFQPDDGVLPGEYKVVVIKSPGSIEEEMASYDRNNPEDVKRMLARDTGGNVAFTPSVLPRSYLDPATTPLVCKVPPDEEVVELKLTSILDDKQR
jgi:hypothetical protein